MGVHLEVVRPEEIKLLEVEIDDDLPNAEDLDARRPNLDPEAAIRTRSGRLRAKLGEGPRAPFGACWRAVLR